MKINLVGLLFVLGGIILLYAGIKNLDPRNLVKDALTGKLSQENASQAAGGGGGPATPAAPADANGGSPPAGSPGTGDNSGSANPVPGLGINYNQGSYYQQGWSPGSLGYSQTTPNQGASVLSGLPSQSPSQGTVYQHG